MLCFCDPVGVEVFVSCHPVRGCRYAQPPANGLNPVGVPDALGFSFAKAPTVGIVNPTFLCECTFLSQVDNFVIFVQLLTLLTFRLVYD